MTCMLSQDPRAKGESSLMQAVPNYSGVGAISLLSKPLFRTTLGYMGMSKQNQAARWTMILIMHMGTSEPMFRQHAYNSASDRSLK